MGKANKGPRSANALFCASSWLNLKTASILALILIVCCFVGCTRTASSTPNPFVRESTTKIQNFDEFAKTKLDRKIKEVFDLKELGLSPPHENFESFRRRNLLGSTSASASTVTGTGVVNNNALTSQTVTVVAKDSSGNNRNTGGDLFYIKVDNKSTCTSAFSCSLVAGAPTTITTPIFTLMTDLGNGNYTYSYTVNINGYLTVSVLLYNRGYIRAQVYGTYDLSGSVVVDTYVSNINFNWGSGYVMGSGYVDYCSVRFTSYLRPPSSTTYSFHVDSDDGSNVYIGGTYYVGGKGTQCICSYDFSATLTGNTDYYFMIEFGEYGGGALVDMLWSYNVQSQVVVPSNYFYYPEQVGSTPYQVTVSCPPGYSGTQPSSPTMCITVCGDGLKAGIEKCDDANTNNGDGCNSSCTSVESSWVCSGGSTTARDTCTFCTAGLYQNDATTPTTCVTHCGDGLRAGTEKCDDANTNNGDGCNSLCTSVESSWVCSGGSTTARDTCTFCTAGLYQNDATTPTTCVTHCGDGLKAGSEKCDDANTNNGDGCNSSCTSVESSWVCSGGSTTARDTCTYCSSGWYQNDATTPTTCVTHCGDGLRAGTEKCDDGNIINGDGCLYDCSAVQSGWVCSGGTTTTIDSCTECMPGYYQNNALTPTSCVTICGDGFEAGTEKCDDANTASGDGCNSSCTSVEAGWVCSGGSVISRDTCTQCAAGYYQDNSLNPQTCVTNCGDSKRVGSEKCDDGNTNNSDGCKSDCSSVESGWVCSGGSSSSRDTCTQCTSGLYQNDSNNPTSCVPHCGDGLKAGSEKCDDGNTSNGDGCNSACTGVETSWVCTGGSPTAKDVCSFCSSGWYQNDATTPTTCVTHCGDGFEAGTEKCDDANTNNGDGCKADCSSVETGWVCIGGSTTSRDTCTFCTAGFYQNSASNPETCVPHCGDGLRVGTEKCDDNNTNNSDGCKSDCSGVESGWVCSGGSSTSKDTCTFCTSGWYQNDPTTPTVCVTHCGDGLEAGTEKCDDNNTNNGDGCKSDCSSVDSGWVCTGGSTTSKDLCQKCSTGFIPDSSTNPENCITVCGDGKRAGSELCDDGNTSNGDGCSSNCSTIEYDWACNGGDVNNKDICQKCHLCYEANNNQRDCIPSDIPYRIKQFASIYLVVLCIGMIFNLLSTKMYGCSSISAFGVFYQIQMFFLIPMIGADVSSDSIYFFEYVKDLLVSFYLLPKSFMFVGHGNIFSGLNYSQSNWYLNLIGLSSGSSLYNMNNYICICCYILIIIILIIPAYSCTKSQEPNSNRHKASKKAFDFIMSQFIFRFILLSYLFLLILSMSEVMNFSRISDGTVSYIFSCSVLSLCIGMLVLSLIKFVSVRKEENFENLFYTKELFNGVKKSWLARTYSSMWMFRRVLFTAVFIAFSNLEFFYKLIASLMIQCLYLIYLCAVRPFESIKDTIGEISNEVFVLLGLFSMCYFNTESKWSSNATQAYLGMLLLSNVVFTTLAIGGFVAQTIKRRLEIREQNARTTRVEDISHIKDITRDNILNLSSIYQLHRRGIPEEEKKADQTKDTLNKSRQLDISKDAMITQTWRIKKNPSDSIINQIAQRELDKMPANIRKIFNNQDVRR